MQTTLLGLAFAVILALVAALVGPHFIDWTNYRATFEREATRLVGMPVRISGPIDVRILPTPTLTFGTIEAGDAAAPTMSARELHAELALGSLVRGEVRASDLRVVGPDVRLGLASDGRIDWPAARMGFDADQLVLERVAIEGGRLTLTNAANASTTTLEGVWFNGDVRSLLGPIKGEGGFIAESGRYGYRIAAGRAGEDGATKLRLSLDPTDHPLSLVADGALRIDSASPRFEGSLSVSRAVAVAGANGRGTIVVPWRLASRVKASTAQALFEQVEFQYGPDERSLKLTGTADLRLGKAPRLDAVLSARQADLDRAFDLPDAARRVPFTAIRHAIDTIGVAIRPPFPVHLGIGLDAVTLAGGTLQGLRGDLNLEGDGWDIETLEFRAPGFAQVRLSGRVAIDQRGATFKGPAKIDANDPRALLAWLEGRAVDPTQPQFGALRASGDLAIGVQEIAAERLRVEYDRKTIEGRLAYSHALAGRAARLEADLKAGEIDIDGLMAFSRTALGGTGFERPGEVALTADIGRATIAGVDVKGIKGKLRLDPEGLAFDSMQIADLAGAAFNLNGRMDGPLSTPRGSLGFDVDARSLDGTVAVLAKFLPQAAEPLRTAAPKLTPLKARVTLNVEKAPGGGSTAKLGVDGNAGALRLRLTTDAIGDIAALTLPEVRVNGQVTATDGGAIVALLGLDRAVTVDKRPGTLTFTAWGATGSDLRVDAKLNAGGLAATANGTTRLFAANGVSAALDLTLQGDAAPLRRGAAPMPVKLQARVSGQADDFTIDNLSGAIAGSPVRGKLKVVRGTTTRVDGRIDAEAVDAAALIATAVAAPSARGDTVWPAEPFGEGLFGEYDGRIDVTVARAAITPTLMARQVRGAVRLGAGEIALEEFEGTLAGGRASGQLILKRVDVGLSAAGRLSLMGADAASLLPGDSRSAVSGHVGLQVTVEGAGLSPAALMGALDGSGTVTLEEGAFSWLDPKAFGAAVRLSDQSAALDATKVRDVIMTVLDGGSLGVPRLDGVLTISAGQARMARTMVPAQGADLTLSGAVDLVAATFDARLTLTGPNFSDTNTTARPDILVLVKGPLSAPKRTVDASTLSGWLMLRSVERQSKRLEAIEAERREAAAREAEQPVAPPPPAPAPAAPLEAAPAAPTAAAPMPAPAPPVSAALPAPTTDATPGPAPETPAARPQRPARPPGTARANDQAPTLPPPLEITPAPGNGKQAAPKTAAPAARPAPPPRSPWDALFGPLR